MSVFPAFATDPLFRSRTIYLLTLSNFTSATAVGLSLIQGIWYLVNAKHGNEIFSSVAFVTNLAMVFLVPLLGVFIDRSSRKLVMLSFRGTFLIILGLAYLLYYVWAVEIPALIILYALGWLFITVNNLGRAAFVQEIIGSSKYNFVNSLMEVEGQFATTMTGFAIAVLLRDWDLRSVMMLSAGLMTTSFLAISFIPYQRTIPSHRTPQTIYRDFDHGLRYLLNRPTAAVMMLCSFAPYICVIIGNYLIPILLVGVLGVQISSFGKYEMLFGAGAIVSGLMLPWMLRRFDYTPTIVFHMVLFTAVVFCQATAPSVLTIIWMAVLLGFANSGIRIARGSWIMQITDHDMIGRVNSTLSSIVLGVKAVLTGLTAVVVISFGAASALWVLFLLLAVAAVLAIWSSQKILSSQPQSP